MEASSGKSPTDATAPAATPQAGRYEPCTQRSSRELWAISRAPAGKLEPVILKQTVRRLLKQGGATA